MYREKGSPAASVSDLYGGSARLAVLPQVPSRVLYQLIVKQLQFDGYCAAASFVADATGVSDPAVERNGNLLFDLVNLGLAHSRYQTLGVRKFFGEHVVERYLSASKVYAPLSISHGFSIGRHDFAFSEKFTTAVLGGVVRDVGFSPDGQLVSCCGTDGLSVIFSLESMQNLVGLTDAQSSIYDKIDGKSNRNLLSFDTSMAQHVNEYTDLATARRFTQHSGSVEFMRFHPTQQLLASGGTDRSLHVCDYTQPDNKMMLKIVDTYPIRSGTFHPTGEYILFVTDHSVPRLLNLRTEQVLTTSATLSTDGERHATVMNAGAGLTSAAFSSDGRYFTLSSLDGSWSLNDGVSGKCVFRAADAHGTVPVTSAVFSRTGQVVLTCGMDSVARLWDIRRLDCNFTSGATSGTTGKVMEVMAFGEPTKCEHRSIRACFSSDESHVLCQDASLCAVHSYSVYSGNISATLATMPSFMQRGLAVSSFTNLIVTGGDDRRLRLWGPSYLPE